MPGPSCWCSFSLPLEDPLVVAIQTPWIYIFLTARLPQDYARATDLNALLVESSWKLAEWQLPGGPDLLRRVLTDVENPDNILTRAFYKLQDVSLSDTAKHAEVTQFANVAVSSSGSCASGRKNTRRPGGAAGRSPRRN